MNFLLSLLQALGVTAFFLRWSQGRIERQIDRMQEAAFNTPGAEAPVTPEMLIAGAGLFGAHLLVGSVLGLRKRYALLSFLLGSAGGVLLFLFLDRREAPR